MMECCSKKDGRKENVSPIRPQKRRIHPALWGVIGAAGMLGFYATLLSILNSPSHAWSEFIRFWYWILLLAAGFGIQVGLYAHVHHTVKDREATGALATSGSISGVSMAACCAHHLSDVLPVIGLGAASTFLVRYQTIFIIAGVISSLIGIMIMLHHIKKHKLYAKGSVLEALLKQEALLYSAFGVSALALLALAISKLI